MTTEERSSEARAIAEQALVWLLHELRDEPVTPIVLGGLVPPLLTGNDPGHLGTTDVDILLITHVEATTRLAAVEHALDRMEFEPLEEAWRWRGLIAGVPVKVEFLCDLDEYREGDVVRPAGCDALGVVNLRGTRYVGRDTFERELSATLPGGRAVTVVGRFAGLAGYLLSKAVAVRTRAADKDYYDFAYVLIHNNAGGPEAAAARLMHGRFDQARQELRSTFVEVRERYRRTSDTGPVAYATQSALADPAVDELTLRADAVTAVEAFFGGLRAA